MDAQNPTTTSRSQRAIQIVAIIGIALVIAAGLVVLGTLWPDFTLVTRMLLLGSGALVLGVGAVVVATRPPGVAALRQTDLHSKHEGRRQFTAVLLIGTAVMVVATILQLPTEPANNFNLITGAPLEPPYWTASIALATGLAIALVAAYVAPGVVATLGTWFLSVSLISMLIERLTWTSTATGVGMRATLWQCVALGVLGLLAAVWLHRYLRPSILVVALGVGTWFFSAMSAAGEAPPTDNTLPFDTEIESVMRLTSNVGKASLAILLVLGVVMFIRRAEWPWPAGAVASLVSLTTILTVNTLGFAMSLLITGILLVLVAGGMAVMVRRRQEEAAAIAPAAPPESASEHESATEIHLPASERDRADH